MNEISEVVSTERNEVSPVPDIRNDQTIAGEINAIKKQTAQICLRATIEVGRLLCEAKEMVPYGNWGAWLESNVSYSVSNANNLMRLYREYGQRDQLDFFRTEDNLAVFEGLTPTQALALTALPEPERREFVETHDMDNTSVRDIQAEIKARQAAEKRVQELESELSDISAERDSAEERAESFQMKALAAETEREKAAAEIEDIRTSAITAAEEKVRADFEAEKKRIKTEIEEKWKKKLEKSEEKLSDALTAAEDEKKKIAAEAKDAAEKEYAEKISALEEAAKRAEVKASAAANADVQRFAVLFEQFQRTYGDLQSILARVKTTDEATADKLDSALGGIIGKWGTA